MQKAAVVLLLFASLVFILLPLWVENLSSDACLEYKQGLAVCAVSDMARLPNHGKVRLEHDNFAIRQGPLQLDAARNETIAFQLIIQNRDLELPESVHFEFADFKSDNAILEVSQTVSFYQAWYHYVDNGGYTWGPKSDVLDWPEYYPDALVPQHVKCTSSNNALFNSVTVPTGKKALQSVWVDIYVPREQAAGIYRSQIIATLKSGEALTIPVRLKVWPASLPDKPSFDAVGEVYRSYVLEGVGTELSIAAWQQMAHCYQRLAHKHRLVFIERSAQHSQGGDWLDYDAVYDPILSGSLFSPENGYFGTGQNTPVSVWRTPWPQDYDVEMRGPLEDTKVQHYQVIAGEWAEHVRSKGWLQTDYFAYIFDEVDGPTGEKKMTIKRRDYLAMTHQQMKRVQDALDKGSGDIPIDLLWTSHSNPLEWSGIKELDLAGNTRLWAPNAHAASPVFLAMQKKKGDKIWFYHSGHPAVGVHSINASGIEMRTWGVISARYNFDGQLMWAINLGNDEQPFAKPVYKDDDDRFGNGVMVYPGNQLPKIGFPAHPGPIPSMRLKAWRQGLQDAELAVLAANKGQLKAVDALLRSLIPTALAEAGGDAKWPDDAAQWIEFHKQLLALASAY